MSTSSSASQRFDFGKQIPVIRNGVDYSTFISKYALHPTNRGDFSSAAEVLLLDEAVSSVDESRGPDGSPLPKRQKKIRVPNTTLAESSNERRGIAPKFRKPPTYVRHCTHKEYVSPLVLPGGFEVHLDLLKPDLDFLEEFNELVKSSLGRPLPSVSWTSERLEPVGELMTEKDVISDAIFNRILDSLEKASKRHEALAVVESVLLIHRIVDPSMKVAIICHLHDHWSRRRLKIGRPLLRQFWPQTAANDTNPFAVFRTRHKERMVLRRPRRSVQDNMQRFQSLLADFRRVARILAKIRTRDTYKLGIARLNALIFEQLRAQKTDGTFSHPGWPTLKEEFLIQLSGRTSPPLRCSPPLPSLPPGILSSESKLSAADRPRERRAASLSQSTSELPPVRRMRYWIHVPPPSAVSHQRTVAPCRIYRRTGRNSSWWIDVHRVSSSSSSPKNYLVSQASPQSSTAADITAAMPGDVSPMIVCLPPEEEASAFRPPPSLHGRFEYQHPVVEIPIESWTHHPAKSGVSPMADRGSSLASSASIRQNLARRFLAVAPAIPPCQDSAASGEVKPSAMAAESYRMSTRRRSAQCLVPPIPTTTRKEVATPRGRRKKSAGDQPLTSSAETPHFETSPVSVKETNLSTWMQSVAENQWTDVGDGPSPSPDSYLGVLEAAAVPSHPMDFEPLFAGDCEFDAAAAVKSIGAYDRFALPRRWRDQKRCLSDTLSVISDLSSAPATASHPPPPQTSKGEASAAASRTSSSSFGGQSAVTSPPSAPRPTPPTTSFRHPPPLLPSISNPSPIPAVIHLGVAPPSLPPDRTTPSVRGGAEGVMGALRFVSRPGPPPAGFPLGVAPSGGPGAAAVHHHPSPHSSAAAAVAPT